MGRPRILIVGAGAVGQVYAYHLQRGGADIGLYVRPKYVAACREGLVLYPLRGRGRGQAITLRDVEVVCTADEVRRSPWDQVWLCISSTGLRGGATTPEAPSWLDELLPATGDATIVSFQPDLGDLAFLTHRVPAARVVVGLINLIAYQSPLPGERRDPPGVAYYLPPLMATPFSGARPRVDAVVTRLRAGGCPAARARDVAADMAFSSSMLIPGIAALETAGWSLRQLTGDAACRRRAQGAIREATAIARPGFRRWLVALATSGLALRVAGWLLPRVAPFDLETYLRYHFTKVGGQTRLMLATYCQRGDQRGLPHATLDGLRERLALTGG